MAAQAGEDGTQVHAGLQVRLVNLVLLPLLCDNFLRKPRKDKRKGEKFTGAQGSDQGKSETYDYSNRVAGAKEAAAKVG